MARIAFAIGLGPLAAAAAFALDCPTMPQQASRDAEVEVRVGVRSIGDARGVELSSKTRQLTSDLMGRLPQADRVYLEQMMFASYCSALKANASLSEAEREARVRAYSRELRAALPGGAAPPVARADPRDAARAELARLPVEYTPDAFVAAAERGDARVVGLFITAGLDVNGANRNDVTALAYAAGRGDLPMVQALLRAGAKVDTPLRRGDTGLSSAAYGGHDDVLRMLLKSRPGRETVDTAFVSAAAAGQLSSLNLLLEQGVDVKVRGPEALQRLMTSSSNTAGKIAVAKRLLSLGVPIESTNRNGWNLLVNAVHQNNLELVRFALDAGSDINRRCDCSGYMEGGFTALGVAVVADAAPPERLVMVDLLLSRGADVAAKSTEGRTSLLVALDRHRDAAVVARLLAAGSDPNARDNKGNTALGLAARSPENMRLLLAAGAFADQRDGRGGTALMAAAAYGNLEGMRLLLDAGEDVNASSKRSRTPLMIAVLSDQPEAARLLLQRGARANMKDEDGRSAEAHALESLKGEAQTRMLSTLRRGGTP